MAEQQIEKKNFALPEEFKIAHELCFFLHDLMLEILSVGEKNKAYSITIKHKESNEKKLLDEIDDIFLWLDKTKKIDEKKELLKKTIFPALLSDMLLCIFAALENAEKGRLNLTYMLIRKPLQENLFLFESIILNLTDFTQKIEFDPLKLRQSTMGGIDNHIKRVENVLDIMANGENTRFNGEYIARLRYDKNNEDSFDRICNHAMHLFTSHHAIRTENMNINFIFSNYEAKVSQWKYLYSRLPYLLDYMYCIIEYISIKIVPTTLDYLTEIRKRINALVILWYSGIQDENYIHPEIKNFVFHSYNSLQKICCKEGLAIPCTYQELMNIYSTGKT